MIILRSVLGEDAAAGALHQHVEELLDIDIRFDALLVAHLEDAG